MYNKKDIYCYIIEALLSSASYISSYGKALAGSILYCENFLKYYVLPLYIQIVIIPIHLDLGLCWLYKRTNDKKKIKQNSE